MDFKKYNSVENSDQSDFVSAIIRQGYAGIEYVVQEKVHGANISFITNGEKFLTAKRTELITGSEQFYNHQTVGEKYKEKLRALFTETKNLFDAKSVTVFGELFGGGYPHPVVPADENAKLVQRGIYYCPTNDFYAFDILIDNEKYLDTDLCSELFEKFDFLYARTLFNGTLSKCMSYPNEFKTTIPRHFNLPELEGNICEGVVIRPVKPIFLQSGARVLLKNKNERWAENNRFVDQEILNKLLHEGEVLSEQANFLCEEIYKLITANRLTNVISKIGEINPKKDYGKLLGIFNKDVLDDFFKSNHSAYNGLEKHESRSVNKFLNKHAGILINEYLDK